MLTARIESLQVQLDEERDARMAAEFALNCAKNQNREHEADYLAVWRLVKRPNESVVDAVKRLTEDNHKLAHAYVELRKWAELIEDSSLPPMPDKVDVFAATHASCSCAKLANALACSSRDTSLSGGTKPGVAVTDVAPGQSLTPHTDDCKELLRKLDNAENTRGQMGHWMWEDSLRLVRRFKAGVLRVAAMEMETVGDAMRLKQKATELERSAE